MLVRHNLPLQLVISFVLAPPQDPIHPKAISATPHLYSKVASEDSKRINLVDLCSRVPSVYLHNPISLEACFCLATELALNISHLGRKEPRTQNLPRGRRAIKQQWKLQLSTWLFLCRWLALWALLSDAKRPRRAQGFQTDLQEA